MNENELKEACLNIERMQKDLSRLRKAESDLRKKVFDTCFSEPSEGTNTAEFSDFVIKGVHKINRRLDESMVNDVADRIGHGVMSTVVTYKPSLVKAGYTKLTDKHRKIVDDCVIATPGTPDLKFVFEEPDQN